MPRWFSDILVPKLLLPPKIIIMFGPKVAIFAPKYDFSGTYRPCWLIWCPVGWLASVCGAQAVSRKTHIYFMLFIHVTNILILLGSLVVSRKIIEL